YGKVPPQAKDLEEAVLGAIMLEKGAFDTVAEILKPESFYTDAHQRIFKAFKNIAAKSSPIDILTTVEELKRSEELDIVGGPFYVTKLTNAVVNAANIEAHARIIQQKFIQRELIRISGEIICEAYEESTDVFDLMDNADKKLSEIIMGCLQKGFVHVSEGILKSLTRMDETAALGKTITGVSSGYADIDRITRGWQPADLIILAARPSVGKTALALNIARNAAMHPQYPVGVGFFSLEQGLMKIADRLLSAESEVWIEKIQRANINEHDRRQLDAAINRLYTAPLFIDDTSALNIFEFKTKARKLVNKHQVGLIIIDYLQLMQGEGKGNREQDISSISRNLKAIAKELNIPIIALSQLNRAVETRRESKMPMLADLRESGAIEQDADLVAFIYRPEYYEQHSNEHGESTMGETHIKIAKHRDGVLDTVKLRAALAIQKFYNWDGVSGTTKKMKDAGFISIGSRLKKEDAFDEGFEEDAPF
ncbi:MAG TPA: replicative DNA helicase, partial [Panacibacter sp.]|nr:replicative DNA helicase [Panacibacter sp.]